ncbi:hypothetical protein EB796_022325 [Bugula neritina]|uniref:RING-type domain-containing protein n=1 Tax=Bugula neritina TaxID=10212 RepID=A0A7J7J1P0_BUGNE|nr:hypothetical protein EB796_022325 [Bugula neritina]
MAESDTSLSRSPQKCAYCQQKLGDIEQLKQLPCSHTACLKCLDQDSQINGIGGIKCPVCRFVIVYYHCVLRS